jgi:hypothetical protein
MAGGVVVGAVCAGAGPAVLIARRICSAFTVGVSGLSVLRSVVLSVFSFSLGAGLVTEASVSASEERVSVGLEIIIYPLVNKSFVLKKIDCGDKSTNTGND